MSSSFEIGRSRRLRRIGHGALLSALALALTATAVLPQVARAIAKINDVRVAGDASGEGASDDHTADSGTESVFVLFDYSGASRNTRVAVQIVGSSLELFRQEDRYEGDGTATVEVTGDAIFGAVADSLEEGAAVLLASSNQVQRANISDGQLDNDLSVMIGRVNAGIIAQSMLLTLEDGSLRDDVATLDETLGRLSDALADAQATAYGEVAARQAALEGTADDARELETLAGDISDALADLPGLPLPTMGPGWDYDVSVRVSEGSLQDNPAGSASFSVVERTGSITDASVGDKPTAVPTRRPLIGEGSRARSTRTPPPAGSTEQPTAVSSSGSGEDGGDEKTEDKDAEDGAEGQSDTAKGTAAVRPSATLRLKASATTTSLDPSGSATPAAPGAPTQDESGGSDQSDPGEADAVAVGEQADAEAGAPPTWTPAAGAVAGTDAEQGAFEGENEGGSGPNRAMLLLGLLVLVGAGLWFRSRS